MPKQLSLSAMITLPDDVFEAAAIVGKAGKPWAELLGALAADGIEHEHSREIMETRTKAEKKPRKVRTPRAGATPLPIEVVRNAAE